MEELVGKRFNNIDEIKNAIETFTGCKINHICESLSERPAEADFEIDFDFADSYGEVETIFYLKDNAGHYLITEV